MALPGRGRKSHVVLPAVLMWARDDPAAAARLSCSARKSCLVRRSRPFEVPLGIVNEHRLDLVVGDARVL
jgi:hypothetical protein